MSSRNKQLDTKRNDQIKKKQEEPSDETISKNAAKKFLTNEFVDKITRYLATDDLIIKKNKEHNEEIKVLKNDKLELENYILKSLKDMEEEYVNIRGKGQLTRVDKVTKGTVKVTNIKESIEEGIKKENLIEDPEKQMEFINEVLGMIDARRPKKIKTSLKRTFERKPRKKTEKKVQKDKKATK